MLTVDLLPGDAVTLMLGEHATQGGGGPAARAPRPRQALPRPLRRLRRPRRARRPRALDPAEPSGRRRAGRRLAGDARADGGRARHRGRVVGVARRGLSAVWPNSLFDAVARLGSLFGLSMPIFWTGLVLIVVFSLWLQLAAGGRGGLADAPGAAGGHARAAVGGDDRAHDALEPCSTSCARTTCAPRAPRAWPSVLVVGQARAAQRAHPDPHAARSAGRAS